MSNITENASTNAKLMSLLADNGTSFRPGQKIIFNLDPSIAYMKPEESYLVFDLLNNSSSKPFKIITNGLRLRFSTPKMIKQMLSIWRVFVLHRISQNLPMLLPQRTTDKIPAF